MLGRGAQVLNLGPGCVSRFVVIHEFIHALGFYHMQSNYNRDEYVEIVWDNIETGKQHNFNKYDETMINNFGEEYDYE